MFGEGNSEQKSEIPEEELVEQVDAPEEAGEPDFVKSEDFLKLLRHVTGDLQRLFKTQQLETMEILAVYRIAKKVVAEELRHDPGVNIPGLDMEVYSRMVSGFYKRRTSEVGAGAKGDFETHDEYLRSLRRRFLDGESIDW